MRRWLWIILAAGLLGLSGEFAAAEGILQADRLGPVRLGMSVAEAEEALGATLAPVTGDRQEACWFAGRADGADPGIAYMVVADRITRIDVLKPQDGPTPSVTTAAGIGIGATLAEVRRRYGPALPLVPHPIGALSQWALVEPSDQGGIRLHIADGKVIEFWAGREPYLDYPEGCS
ncbi:hypothetical protein SAZ10_21160 [Mesorhizobium sp. BAC0120]|uniref:hypothetical protein n=1 Tax=Mesorhizobium sp. BAC0120 TaxID=3090670 RepID=UPI00298C0593|nr:hypothetical protein [Mesorhizobium sp. BAC0120]MDW6024263.1 hypothetical protein [Mesorhizobium sp. BAC0120]